jgi:hypothetical protein
MPDLMEQGFEPLRPAVLKIASHWRGKWAAFKALADEALIPLAEEDIIHANLRPGFDVTSNLLFSRIKGAMRMIDLDSLNSYDGWASSKPVVGIRCTSTMPHSDVDPRRDTALECVFLKVISLTVSWMRELGVGLHENLILSGSEMATGWSNASPPVQCDGGFIH